MKKPTIEIQQTLEKDLQRVLLDLKENINILTGRSGGVIGTVTPGALPSAGIAVNSATATLVTLKTEHDALVTAVQALQTAFVALVARLNTP